MILQQIGQLVNKEAESVASKLSLDQIDHFLNVVCQDIDLAEHVLELIQKSHGIGLEIPAEPQVHPEAPTGSE